MAPARASGLDRPGEVHVPRTLTKRGGGLRPLGVPSARPSLSHAPPSLTPGPPPGPCPNTLVTRIVVEPASPASQLLATGGQGADCSSRSRTRGSTPGHGPVPRAGLPPRLGLIAVGQPLAAPLPQVRPSVDQGSFGGEPAAATEGRRHVLEHGMGGQRVLLEHEAHAASPASRGVVLASKRNWPDPPARGRGCAQHAVFPVPDGPTDPHSRAPSLSVVTATKLPKLFVAREPQCTRR